MRCTTIIEIVSINLLYVAKNCKNTRSFTGWADICDVLLGMGVEKPHAFGQRGSKGHNYVHFASCIHKLTDGDSFD